MANKTPRFVTVTDATGVERTVRRVDAKEIADIAKESAQAEVEVKPEPKAVSGKGKAAKNDEE